ncbi:hypothetical protein F2Q70_00009890 [Brassica cretica]|uniref:Reverse transcriptase zinc-binding domain-containing protein n=1 Tax=Brassica cretica TaxID=69181 RepID=A0A8S9LXR6_BRACR|nr:hypothetical protein F2Q70_00009890 [Brassica cretica]
MITMNMITFLIISPTRIVKLRIQNGESALFWFDNWTPFGSLSDHLSNSPSRLGIPPHATVSSLFRNGSWHLPPARTETQVQLQAYLMTITLTEDQDYYEWEINGQVSERFKTMELYAYLCAERGDVQWSKAVWFSGGIPRHNFHTWLLVLDRIPTRDRLITIEQGRLKARDTTSERLGGHSQPNDCASPTEIASSPGTNGLASNDLLALE